MSAGAMSVCPGCAARVPIVEELRSAHLYIGAAPGCWAAYMALTARLAVDPLLASARLLAADAYPAQHPGVPGRQASQSVWVHLAGLCLVLERGLDPLTSARAKSRLAGRRDVFGWLEPPSSLGSLTVVDVLATNRADLEASVRAWADAVWAAWAGHHGAVSEWVSALLHD